MPVIDSVVEKYDKRQEQRCFSLPYELSITYYQLYTPIINMTSMVKQTGR
jgi:hypothetical protein